MNNRSWLWIAVVSMFFVGWIANTFCVGQFSGVNRDGAALINDLPRPGAKELSRFQIVSIVSHTFLLDGSTGDTWVLTLDPDADKPSWVEVPRISRKKQAEPAMPAPEGKPKLPGKIEKDPFG